MLGGYRTYADKDNVVDVVLEVWYQLYNTKICGDADAYRCAIGPALESNTVPSTVTLPRMSISYSPGHGSTY